ncbi:MAG: SDR family oxidoreductase [Planctomycetota bacterium]
MSRLDYAGRSALVTGASSGIGRALALELARRGASVTLVARREERLRALAEEISTAGGSARVLVADLLDPAGRDAVIGVLADPEATPDILVNNAAFGVHARFLDTPPERLEACLRLALEAPVVLTRAFLGATVERREAAVLLVASIASFVPTPWHGLYSAAKAGLASLGEALAIELEEGGGRVTCLCPGVTETEFFRAGDYDESGLMTRIGRMSPERVARAGLDGLSRGRPLVVPGFANRVLVGLARALPSAWVVPLAGLAMRRRDAPSAP